VFFLALNEFGHFSRLDRSQCLHGIDKIYAAITVDDLTERFDFVEIGKGTFLNTGDSDVADKGHGVFIIRVIAQFCRDDSVSRLYKKTPDGEPSG